MRMRWDADWEHTINQLAAGAGRDVSIALRREAGKGHGQRTRAFVGEWVAEQHSDGSWTIGSTWSLAHMSEFGTVNKQPQSRLRNAARAIGLDVR